MMKKFLLLLALIFSFAFDANAADETSGVICSIISYTQNANYGLADEERVGNGRFFAL